MNKAVLLVLVVVLMSSYALASLEDGLIAYYPFNGNANDESGNGHDGTVYGATLTSDRYGNDDSAYSFDGVDDYIDLPSMTPTNDFSVSFWVKLDMNSSEKGDETEFYGMYKDNYGAYMVQQRQDGDLIFFGSYSNGWYFINSSNGVNLKNSWHLITCTRNSTNGMGRIYIDGILVKEEALPSPSGDHAGSSNEHHIGKSYNDAYFVDGIIDEVRIYDRVLSSEEVQSMYSIRLVSPTNREHVRSPVNLTYRIEDGNTYNCTLYLNNVENETHYEVSEDDYFEKTFSDGTYNWSVNCSNTTNTLNSEEWTFTVDTIKPVWTIRTINLDNTTKLNKYYNTTLDFNDTVFDENLFGYNITIRNSTGSIMWSKQVTDLAVSEVNITDSVDLSSWKSDNYTITWYAEDDHTATKLQPLNNTITAESIIFTLPDGSVIIIENPNSTNITLTKLTDRYTWNVSYSTPCDSPAYIIKSNKEIHNRTMYHPYPSFVIGKYWVDFNTDSLTSTPQVTNLGYVGGYYSYKVQYTDSNVGFVSFRSLGGLNNATETASFELNNIPRQDENLTSPSQGDKWIYITWDAYPETVKSEVWVNDEAVANTTNNYYNITGLTGETTYTITVYAINDEDKKNTDVTSENRINATTKYDSQVNMTFYNEVTGELVTNNVTFNIIKGNDTVYNGSTTTGHATLTDKIGRGNYTIRYEALNYSTRDYYFTLKTGQNLSLDLYMIEKTDSTLLPINIIDYDGRDIGGVVIKWERYMTRESGYKIVEMVTTDDNGDCKVYFQPYDAWYKAIILYNNNVVKITQASRYSTQDATNGVTIPIDVSSDVFESAAGATSLIYTSNITYDYDNKAFTLTYDDKENILEEICLKVYEMKLGRIKEQVNETCSNDHAGTLVAGHPSTNNTVLAEAWLETNTNYSNYIINVKEVITNLKDKAFTDSLFVFMGVILVSAVSLLLTFNPAAPIIVSTIGLASMAFLTFVGVSTTVLTTLTGMALVIAFIISMKVGK
jgi:hypothetical protein